jgi:undecaprenyl diphosphate synthase
MSLVADQQHAVPADREGRPTPRHVAIIMDGNGRWATERGLPRREGHRRGVEAVRKTVRAATELGIRHLTLYSFSSENWTRPRDEIDFLFGLFRLYIRRDVAELHDQGVRISMIGSREGVPADMLALIDDAAALTAGNRKLHLVLAFNYGARDEIARAARRIAEEAKAGRLDPGSITEATIANQLDTASYPDPDLVIRTGREIRLSNFLLWQSAYAELIFLKLNWPDFGREALIEAISEFGTRTRRYGGHGVRESA